MADREGLSPEEQSPKRTSYDDKEEEEEDIFTISTDPASNHDHHDNRPEEDITIHTQSWVDEGERRGVRGLLVREKAEEEVDFFAEHKQQREEEGLPADSERWEDGDGEDESEELPSPSGLSGTTPPAGSRYMKHARRTNKYKGVKKLSLGHVPKLQFRDTVKKRPHSMVDLQPREGEGEKGRRNTAPAISVRRRRCEGVRVGESPQCEAGQRSLQRKKKKKSQRKITNDRDKKAALNPSSPLSPQTPSPRSPRKRPPLIPVQSVDIPDYTPSLAPPTDHLTASLTLLLPPHRSSSAGINERAESIDFQPAPPGRVFRSYSDAHVSLTTSMGGRPWQQDERGVAVCPLDRKQFFKRFQRELKYSAGINHSQPHPPETPFHPHMSRYHSENLGLENPQGFVLHIHVEEGAGRGGTVLICVTTLCKMCFVFRCCASFQHAHTVSLC